MADGDVCELALRLVRESPDLGYDVETSGLSWKENAVVGYVIGNKEVTAYVPIRHGGGGNIPGGRPMTGPTDAVEPHPFETALAEAFTYRRRSFPHMGRTVGHNIKFDLHMSKRHGIDLGRHLEDTSLNEALLDEFARTYSLDATAQRYGVTPKQGERLYQHLALQFGGPAKKDQMANFWRLAGNDPVAVEYATGDIETTLALADAQRPLIEEQGLNQVWQLECDLIYSLFRMEQFGIRIDMDEIDVLEDYAEREASRMIKELGEGFNPRSPVKMRGLMEKHGHTDWPTTEKGNPSFTEKWLKTHEVGRTVIDIRQKTNLLNSFVRPLKTRHIYDGRVHCSYNQLKSDDFGTIAGRLSCSDPNLQQVPKRNKDLAIPFRRLFLPDEGRVFWERDWSQCEPRLFAHYSRDKKLVEGYCSEPFVDAHTVVAQMLDVERDPTAKRMNMGIFTGMQPRTFSQHMGWDFNRAKMAHEQWFRSFPAVREFQNQAKAVMKSRGHVKTLLGRRCRLDDPRFAYRATSRIIQGSNADIMKYCMLEMDKACESAGDIVRLLVTVHDSFGGDMDQTPEAQELMRELVSIMEDVQGDPFHLDVPFVAEGHEGANWAEASFSQKDIANARAHV